MRHRLSCKSSFVVYFVTCIKPHAQRQSQNQTGLKICGKQYTGCTTETMALRHAGHRTEIKNKSSPLGRHFAECGIENFSLQIIDTVKVGQKDALEILEGFWTHRLATFQVHNHLNKVDELSKIRKP